MALSTHFGGPLFFGLLWCVGWLVVVVLLVASGWSSALDACYIGVWSVLCCRFWVLLFWVVVCAVGTPVGVPPGLVWLRCLAGQVQGLPTRRGCALAQLFCCILLAATARLAFAPFLIRAVDLLCTWHHPDRDRPCRQPDPACRSVQVAELRGKEQWQQGPLFRLQKTFPDFPPQIRVVLGAIVHV